VGMIVPVGCCRHQVCQHGPSPNVSAWACTRRWPVLDRGRFACYETVVPLNVLAWAYETVAGTRPWPPSLAMKRWSLCYESVAALL
jgi:hypothetical protein